MSSLTRRLSLTLFIALGVGGLVAALGLYWQAMEELNEQFDSRLSDVANNLSATALQQQAPRKLRTDEEPEDDIVVQLWAANGQLLYHSDAEQAPFPIQPGSGLYRLNGEEWHSYARLLADGRLLQVAQLADARSEMAVASAVKLLIPLAVIIPLLALFVTWLIWHQLSPLRSLARQLQHRGTDDASPLRADQPPKELAPIIAALNALFVRQARAAEQQRVFLAEAAHELRTPVAVVQLQLQQAQHAPSEAGRQQALSTLQQGVERLSHLVTQLLALARSDAGALGAQAKTRIALDNKLREWLAELHPMAEAKSLDLGLIHTQPCDVLGHPSGLQSLVVNIVQNAIAYTPAGGAIDVSLAIREGGICLTVSDTGPGIAVADREPMFNRFARGQSTTQVGSGLGLAIVREQAARHGGRVQLLDGPNGRGLSVVVSLPLAAPVAD